MPFSKENRRFTLSLIALVVISLAGIVAFVSLSKADPERTTLYGAVLGTLCPVLAVQVFSLSKIGKVEETVQDGQTRAAERGAHLKREIQSVKETVESSEGMPRTPGELRSFIRGEMNDIVEQAAVRAVQLYNDSQRNPGRVQT